jgi:hypothetical protein
MTDIDLDAALAEVERHAAALRDDDWFTPANASPEMRALFALDSVGVRRRWFLNLKREGRL